MRKIVLSTFLMLSIISMAGSISVAAQEFDVSEELVQETPTPKFAGILAASGKTEGNIVPYRRDVNGTGIITVHFEANNIGFVAENKAVYTLMLPNEFKEVASQPLFEKGITGKIRISTIKEGEKQKDIELNMLDVYSDRIYLKIPRSLWIGAGSIKVDMRIDFASLLSANIEVPDNPDGYTFKSELRFINGVFDISKDPIIGSNASKWVSKETSMIAVDEVSIDSASYRKGDKTIKGTYSDIGGRIENSKVFLNGEDLKVEHDDSSFFKGNINIFVGNKLKDVSQDDYLIIKCYGKGGELLDFQKVEIAQ